MLQRIGQIAIIVKDLDRATGFYRDVLGIRFLFSAPPAMSFFDLGGVMLMLAPPENADHEKIATILYFDTDDIIAEHARLAPQRVEFLNAPHRVHRDGPRELWLAEFKDSEGNTFSLRQWRNAA